MNAFYSLFLYIYLFHCFARILCAHHKVEQSAKHNNRCTLWRLSCHAIARLLFLSLSLSLWGFFFSRFTIKTWTSSLSYFFYYFTIFKQNISKKGEKQKFCSFFLCFMFITISYQLFSCLFFYCYHFIVMNIEIV